jgi:acyl-coenzyme A synthetase/AMP-(fatty) acid ligase
LVEGERTITYRELAGLVRRTAGHLAAIGARPGDRVGLCLKDTAAHVIAFMAVGWMGATAVPLDWRARQSENARFVRGLDLAYVLAEADARLTPDARVIPVDDDWHEAVARCSHPATGVGSWGDPLIITASSGSTGQPKYILISHLQYFFRASGILEALALTGRHRFLCTLPLCYSSAPDRCIAHFLRGDCVILYPSLFTPEEYIEITRRHAPTIGILVPTMVRQFLARSDRRLSLPGFAALFATGAPLHADEKRAAARLLTPHFYDAYGTAEIGLLTLLRPEDLAERADSVGQPHSLAQIETVGDDGLALPSGRAGRLRYRGPALGTPIASGDGLGIADGFGDGWHYPGEIAYLDDRCYLFLQGRESEVITRAGAKIHPAEVENALQQHPNVIEGAVVGRTTAVRDEEVIALVVLQEGREAEELLAHCRAHLSPHKVPRQIRVVAQLPRTPSGKIDKAALRALVSCEDGDP